MPAINIRRVEQDRVIFDPSVLTGAVIGDRVFWRNLDPKDEHWITLKGKPQDYWFRFPLARFLDGQIPDTTREIALQTAQDISYWCFLHQSEEGVISFSLAGV